MISLVVFLFTFYKDANFDEYGRSAGIPLLSMSSVVASWCFWGLTENKSLDDAISIVQMGSKIIWWTVQKMVYTNIWNWFFDL